MMRISGDMLLESVREACASGATASITINSESMSPFLHTGDQVTLAAFPEYSPGDILLGRDTEGRVLLHIVEKADGESYVVAGTANIYRKEHIKKEEAVARVVTVCRRGRTVDADSRLWRFMLRAWPGNPLLRKVAIWISSHI